MGVGRYEPSDKHSWRLHGTPRWPCDARAPRSPAAAACHKMAGTDIGSPGQLSPAGPPLLSSECLAPCGPTAAATCGQAAQRGVQHCTHPLHPVVGDTPTAPTAASAPACPQGLSAAAVQQLQPSPAGV